ncbi:MAG: S8 family serine peptidase [bacterium]|nr:S8 family serine peptidase [bacterium]
MPGLLVAALALAGALTTPAAAQVPGATATVLPPVTPAARDHGPARKLDRRLRRLAEAPASSTARQTETVAVTVRLGDPTGLDRLAGLGLVVERRAGRVVEGRIALEALPALAADAAVRTVRPTERGVLRAGAVVTQGDAASGADLVRAQRGFTGSGVTVGVISDGVDSAAAAAARGELPPVVVPADARCANGSGDEGTALLEIVHDVAPGASLLFSGGLSSPLGFADSVRCLTAAGAQVIVDDIAFFSEPFFEDGPVAQAVREAVGGGVSFHSAAGNQAGTHWEGPFRASPGTGFHDFRGGPVDNVAEVLVAPQGSVGCALQWDDPFGASGNDYDLFLLREPFANFDAVDTSENVQSGDGDPFELVSARNNTSGTLRLGLAIRRRSGAAARTLELVCFRNVSGFEFPVPAGSIVGHPAVPEVVAVGAIDVADPGLDTVEGFSSQGPSRIVFPAPAMRTKPDLVAFDGVATSVPGFAPFYGTSAAAPHTAAVAALMLQKNPFLRPAEIASALTTSAIDIGAPGVDTVSGAGRLDALGAVDATPAPECFTDADPDCVDGDPCTQDRCERGRCVHPPVPCDDGDPCNGIETCEPTTGACLAGTPQPDGTPCPDGDVCDGDEVCAGSVCRPGVALECRDPDPCSIDACDPAGGCFFPPQQGFDAVLCLLGQGLPDCDGEALPRLVERRFARANVLVERATQAKKVRKQRLRLRRAARQLERAAARVRRVVRRGRLSESCGAAVQARLGEGAGRARGIAASL